ncbi:MAG: hypothetical protein GX905_07510 [Bacteroidales bacterium]|nr:hypothetical protein [Bacteroidales bacterium]
MEQKILSCFIGLNLLMFFLFGNASLLQAQKKEEQKLIADTTAKASWYRGTYVGVDLFGIGAKVFGGDFLSSEVGVRVNLKNMLYPTLEIGYGSTDTWSENGIHYKSSAPYYRIGADFNTMYKKGDVSHVYVGLRYGMSSMEYDVYTQPIDDPIWGDALENPLIVDDVWGGSFPYDHRGQKASMHWFEIVGGVQVKIYRNIYMGWTLRLKYRVSSSPGTYGDPWYVPGFGQYDSSKIGVTYSLIYKIPF